MLQQQAVEEYVPFSQHPPGPACPLCLPIPRFLGMKDPHPQ